MNVRIRPLSEADAYTSVKWRNIPELWVHTEFKANKEITIQDELDWIRKVTADPSCKRFAIMADEQYVGNIYLTDIKNRAANYHIFIGDQNYWGKGVAKAASLQLIDFAKKTLALQRINLRVRAANAPAMALYRKLGFEKTGVQDGFVAMTLSFPGSSA